MIDESTLYNERFDRIDLQINKIDKQIDKLIELQTKTLEQEFRLNQINESLDKAWEKINELINAPNKMWKYIITCVISSVVSGLIAYIFVKLGLK